MTLSIVIRIAAQNGIQDRTSAPKSMRRNPTSGKGDKGAGKFYESAIGVFRGTLKELTSKEIVIENESKQIVSMRRSQKTKFFRNSEPVRPTEIDLDTFVTGEATENGSVSLKALSVTAEISATTIEDHPFRE